MLTRTLQIEVDRVAVALAVRISDPILDEAGDWFCHYTIDWPDRPREGRCWGIDPIQALELTLQLVGAELYVSDAHAAGKLSWLVPGDGYGFPVPNNLRDLLIGSDRGFSGV